MSGSQISTIVFIGAGNLATNLALTFYKQGIKILQVYSRTQQHARELAEKAGATPIRDLNDLSPYADLYIISVSDAAIKQVAEKIFVKDKLIVHTSGATGMDILKKSSSRFGVFYSPQTFLKDHPISLQDSPVCIEGNNRKTENMLLEFARLFSDRVFCIASEQRQIVHLAAVFAGNFTNFMYTVSNDLLQRNDIPYEMLFPIIRQTAANACTDLPFKHQTGPAVREDAEIVLKHLEMLADHPDYRDIYHLISRNIIKFSKRNE